MTIRIALIDDHPLVVSGYEAALAPVPDLEVVARGSTLEEARELLARDDVDVAVLDVRLQDGNGLQALAERKSRKPAVLVVSSFPSPQYVAAAAKFGGSGFVLKAVPLVALVEAIRAVAVGDQVFTPEQLAARFVSLNPREREVLRLAMEGFSNKEIGARIGTSRKTVEARLSEIFERYGIRGGRIELSIRAADEGWLEIDPPNRVAPKPGHGAH